MNDKIATVGEVWEARDEKTLVRVELVKSGWVGYRRCDGDGKPLPKSRKCYTTENSFARRFVTLIYSAIKSPHE